jgi:hypothetical protein
MQPSPDKPEPNLSKKKAWIPFDRLVRIEPFQWLAATPGAKKRSLLLSSPWTWKNCVMLQTASLRLSRCSDFRKTIFALIAAFGWVFVVSVAPVVMAWTSPAMTARAKP